MVVDTSAWLCILLNEPDATRYAEVLAMADTLLLSSVSYVELGIVISSRHGAAGLERADRLLLALGAETIPFDRSQAAAALSVWQRYGKGNHPARLNFGDCCTYALAKLRDTPLLYKGEDFAQTDIRSALS
ncbi:MAG: type II toxin-antitoxin system VapC family toxin [Methylococcaceae bacterium]|nr:MAG: type II toxin-antitoxin system VapC family toxin [Methylococcaceae bacterium]